MSDKSTLTPVSSAKSEEHASGSVSSQNEPASSSSTESKLSNKELKELKKKEKAAKRAAQKEASGISVEKQQQQAQQKREKKQTQRDVHSTGSKKGKLVAPVPLVKEATLYGHLETTEERRAYLLAVTSAISSSQASKITAAGLMLPHLASAISGTYVPTTSAIGAAPPSVGNTSHTMTTAAEPSVSEIAQILATMSVDDEASMVPGTSTVIPQTLLKSISHPHLNSSIKELIVNRNLLHPAIAQLTSEIAGYKIIGSIPRCLAMLEAFQTAIKDYKTPEGTTLSRNLTSYLSHQIDFLKKARPLSVTMGNAIRWLKQEISLIDLNIPDAVAKENLCEQITQFAREKIEFADQLIIENASQHISNGSTILTYGCSKVLCDLFIHNATKLGKNFQVIIVDSRPLFEGRKMTDTLRNCGLNVMYVLTTSLGTVFNMHINYVFLGAHSILSNGFLYSRVGTAMLAMSAKRRNIPVLVCCESLKFSQRVQLDSVTSNELADPNDLVAIDSDNPVKRRSNKGFLLQQFIKERELEIANSDQNQKKSGKGAVRTTTEVKVDENKPILADWQSSPKLNIFNIMYDLTPPEYIKKIITEFGALPPSSVPVILREYKGSA
ncbi:LANO_0G10198g1_1 [Lachancea nothofagi CBS 11611]|uniref:Translation initiation factor eIF2B subunit delta n=1 Tax=Lachancea nothofagi CBS 11611 TaxID=1266666 RepID=A0A1G4KIP6_9SACH|nr:LANO_0G10198g1_1 [Lachancea nothofagi CBS 11611]